MTYRKFAPLLLLLVLFAGSAAAAELSANQIVRKSHDVYGGDDAVLTLTFHFVAPGGEERKLAYKMAWKRYDHSKFTRKVIFATEFPPDKRGESYMIWSYRPDLHKDNDEWIYMPQLRSIRKVGDTHDEGEKHNKDEFAKRSVLQDPELMPRMPQADDHRLLRTQEAGGKRYFVVESVPKKQTKEYPYSKTLNWIDSDTFLLRRIDYYGSSGKALKREQIDWRKIGKAWVWDKVVAVNLATKDKTVIDLSDVRVNVGLNDRVFSKRTMRLGLGTVVR
ncbi:MAG TPA: outer membrane lipoprotein-sorting protein [Gammaproteobacteria bacterium]|nr:outer membrane lipoprotein-sorting protein [Gammaproteobacteria bacterium]